MNPLFYHRRLWALTMAPLFIFFLARFLFIAEMSSYHYGSSLWKGTSKLDVMTPAHVALPKPIPMPVHAARMESVKAPKVVQEAPAASVQDNGLSLQSTLHEFRYIFSGQVTCGAAPCMAELHVSLQSDYNDDLKQTFSTGPDGRFECRMTFKENLHRPLDWHVMVVTPHTYPVELHGRQILMDDGDLNIEKNIQLP